MTRWATGADQVQALIEAGDLEMVTPSQENAQRLLAEARQHLRSASVLAHDDPPGAYDLLYAAARKALSAVLAVQGLRATSRGGHVAVQEAITAQLGRSGAVVKPFGRLRRTRNEADYPKLDTPAIDPADITEDLSKAQVIVDAMEKLLLHLDPW